jgi:hypothetical protein
MGSAAVLAICFSSLSARPASVLSRVLGLIPTLWRGRACESVGATDERMEQMAVAVDLEFDGGTLEQYDEVAKLMDYEPGGAAPPGCLFHWGALTDRGLRVTDVWETKEQYEQYAQEKIGPYTQQVGIPGPPQITFYDVHNYQAASVPTK